MDPITSSEVFQCHGLGSQLDSARRNCSKSLTIIVSPFCLARKNIHISVGFGQCHGFCFNPKMPRCIVLGLWLWSTQLGWSARKWWMCVRAHVVVHRWFLKATYSRNWLFRFSTPQNGWLPGYPPIGSCSYLPKKYQCVFIHIHCWFKIESPWWGNMDSATLLPQHWIVGVIPCG